MRTTPSSHPTTSLRSTVQSLDADDPLKPAVPRMTAAATSSRHVFVLLPATLDVDLWRRRHDGGEVPDATPYGYHHAERFGYRLSYGRPRVAPGTRRGLLARALFRLFGFDLAHAWHNRRAIRAARADALWFYTEHEFLAALLLRCLGLIPALPMIAQSIWLADEWPRVGPLRRMLYRRLMQAAEICAFNSPVNTEFARRRGWGRRVELIDFGVSLDSFPLAQPKIRRDVERIRVLAIGNDRHRDWPTLHAAFANRREFELRVASTTYPEPLLCDNIAVSPGDQAHVRALYDWADVIVVPLTANLHVSGATVSCESAALGKPVVATDTGGLSHYFGHDQFFFVAIGDSAALRAAVAGAMADPGATEARVLAAQRRLVEREYTTAAYARRHVELTERLLAAASGAAA